MLSMASASAPALAQPAPPTPPTANEIAAGDKAARTKDWEGALTHYQAALHATPSWRAQLGVADALYQLGRLGESYETYDDAQRTYATKYGPGEKGLVGARLKELATKDPRYQVLSFARNFGHQAAITAGVDYARGKAVVVMDADLQDPPEVVEFYRHYPGR